MRNGRLNTSKYRGKLQKMGVLHTPPQEAQALATCKGLKKNKNKEDKKNKNKEDKKIYKKNRLAATC
jgi:hypothetical protein